MTDKQNKPVEVITVKPLTLSIWANTHTNKEGESFTSHSVDIQRCYKEESSGAFKYTRSLRAQDLDKLTLLVGAASKAIENLRQSKPQESAA